MNVSEKLKSRKLWMTLLGTLIVTLGQQLGLPADVVAWISGLIGTYIIGQSTVDAVEKAKG